MQNVINYNGYECPDRLCSNRIPKFRDPVQSKRLADRRWRKSLNSCYTALKETISVNHFGYETNEKKIKSRIALLKITLSFIDKMESLIEQMCKSGSLDGDNQEAPSLVKYKQQFCEQEARKYCKSKKIRPKSLQFINSTSHNADLSFTAIK